MIKQYIAADRIEPGDPVVVHEDGTVVAAKHVELNEASLEAAVIAMRVSHFQLAGLLASLVEQIEMSDFKDGHGHSLKRNAHYVAAKEAVRCKSAG